MTTHWIKLYIEFLDDPKVGMLPEWLQLRFIKLLLVAGEYQRNGLLPPVSSLAWRVRLEQKQVEDTLLALVSAGVVATTPDGYCVTNFSKRQAASDAAQRMKAHRGRAKALRSYVTRDAPYTDTDSDTDTESEEEDSFSAVRNLLERCTGLMAQPGDVPTLQEFAGIDIQEADIRGALEWRKTNGAAPARTLAQLAAGIKTERLKRIQASNAKPASNGNGNGNGRVKPVDQSLIDFGRR